MGHLPICTLSPIGEVLGHETRRCGLVDTDAFALSAFAAFGGIEFLPPAADASVGPGGGETRRCALADHGTLELGEGSDHLHRARNRAARHCLMEVSIGRDVDPVELTDRALRILQTFASHGPSGKENNSLDRTVLDNLGAIDQSN